MKIVRLRTLGTLGPVTVLALVLVFFVACSGDDPPAPTQTATQGNEIAPNFSYIATDGREISLNELTEQYNATVLVFYRGFS